MAQVRMWRVLKVSQSTSTRLATVLECDLCVIRCGCPRRRIQVRLRNAAPKREGCPGQQHPRSRRAHYPTRTHDATWVAADGGGCLRASADGAAASACIAGMPSDSMAIASIEQRCGVPASDTGRRRFRNVTEFDSSSADESDNASRHPDAPAGNETNGGRMQQQPMASTRRAWRGIGRSERKIMDHPAVRDCLRVRVSAAEVPLGCD